MYPVFCGMRGSSKWATDRLQGEGAIAPIPRPHKLTQVDINAPNEVYQIRRRINVPSAILTKTRTLFMRIAVDSPGTETYGDSTANRGPWILIIATSQHVGDVADLLKIFVEFTAISANRVNGVRSL